MKKKVLFPIFLAALAVPLCLSVRTHSVSAAFIGDYNNKTDYLAYGVEVNAQLADEGFVLLKNDVYRVYYGNRMLGMNVLEGSDELTIDEYTVVFENPRNYTLLAVKRDRFTWLVLIGGVITLLGLVLAFYLRPAALFAAEEPDGTWRVCARSRKGGVLFREAFEKAAKEAGFKLTGE